MRVEMADSSSDVPDITEYSEIPSLSKINSYINKKQSQIEASEMEREELYLDIDDSDENSSDEEFDDEALADYFDNVMDGEQDLDYEKQFIAFDQFSDDEQSEDEDDIDVISASKQSRKANRPPRRNGKIAQQIGLFNQFLKDQKQNEFVLSNLPKGDRRKFWNACDDIGELSISTSYKDMLIITKNKDYRVDLDLIKLATKDLFTEQFSKSGGGGRRDYVTGGGGKKGFGKQERRKSGKSDRGGKKNKKDQSSARKSQSNGGNDRRKSQSKSGMKPGTVFGGNASPIQNSNVGHQMLLKLGWKSGQALGNESTSQGIVDPITATIRSKGRGLGAE